MCGEKIRVASPRITQRGSPPRVRGKVAERCYTDCACGITPACAGKRTRRLQMRQDERDHPRVCGEKRSLAHHRGGLLGSPPRVRGKGLFLYRWNRQHGITPACAGKRGFQSRPCPQCRDHPRVCGEKIAPMLNGMKNMGSPPRVRGKDLLVSSQLAAFGITPACAGKSISASVGGAPVRDHPRVCGEKAASKAIPSNGQGSPPRVRGKD